jgi:hypothetical protein
MAAIYCEHCDPDPFMAQVCDFCRLYEFNGDDHGCYTGDGYCRFHGIAMEPFEGCEDFWCWKAKPPCPLMHL